MIIYKCMFKKKKCAKASAAAHTQLSVCWRWNKSLPDKSMSTAAASLLNAPLLLSFGVACKKSHWHSAAVGGMKHAVLGTKTRKRYFNCFYRRRNPQRRQISSSSQESRTGFSVQFMWLSTLLTKFKKGSENSAFANIF